ncbi:hypothetical protein COEREDRAFT_79056 [Coemansia reversa NRRL 1564]|uniref:PAS domain-containing protein n=1 Tax=Coemansia reversa (strain ATCC 12441 / NRRL 1564) TaxID=763665 RepID=A0A2G5BLF6_COERN|nr:hypothetical protein COEREDRAFT_79056 [Coemansia reversa NRRL 1564]|eukprot:PIA19792.1 hypothetical protein COEREDRAFT_79056 [Coemansia reversa NRRL 1564]
MTKAKYDEPVPQPTHPTFLGIHTNDENTQILYISSGVRLALGYTPAELLSKKAKDYIVDSSGQDYACLYSKSDTNYTPPSNTATAGLLTIDEEKDDDEANVYVFYAHLLNASGQPILERGTKFKCDNCVIFIGSVFPEIPFTNRNELEVRMLDGSMKRLNLTRQKELQIERRKALPPQPNYQPFMYRAPREQIKAAFVLEHTRDDDSSPSNEGIRLAGPLIVFVTGSVGHLIEADPSDVMQYPFFKLVAPEDIAHVSEFFEQLYKSADVQFRNFALVKHPHIIEGDIFVHDADNPRIVVECLAAAVDDGVVLMLRKLRVTPPPKRDNAGNYIHSSVYKMDDDADYMSLSELISTDPETSDAPEWSRV